MNSILFCKNGVIIGNSVFTDNPEQISNEVHNAEVLNLIELYLNDQLSSADFTKQAIEAGGNPERINDIYIVRQEDLCASGKISYERYCQLAISVGRKPKKRKKFRKE